MENKISVKNLKIDKSIYIISIIMFAFIPFSYNGIIYQSIYIAKNIFTIFLVIFYGLTRGKIIKKQLIIVINIHIILFFFTWIAKNFSPISFKVDYASYSVIIPLTLLWLFKFDDSICVNKIDLIFNALNIILILWSLGIIFEIQWVKILTYNNFSQFSNYTLPNMLSKNKPVLSFGTHSISSYATFMLFMLNYITIRIRKGQKNIINYIFMWSYLFTNIMTFSNTSFIVSFVIIFLLFKSNKQIIKTFTMGIILIVVVLIIINIGFLDLYTYRLFNQSNNGFLARYSSERYYMNFEFIWNNGGLGLLSDKNNEIFLIDSGFLVLFTRGNILLVILFYYGLMKFIVINIKKKYSLFILLPIFSFEFAASLLLLDIRPLFLIIIIIIYLNTISNEYAIKTNVNQVS